MMRTSVTIYAWQANIIKKLQEQAGLSKSEIIRLALYLTRYVLEKNASSVPQPLKYVKTSFSLSNGYFEELKKYINLKMLSDMVRMGIMFLALYTDEGVYDLLGSIYQNIYRKPPSRNLEKNLKIKKIRL